MVTASATDPGLLRREDLPEVAPIDVAFCCALGADIGIGHLARCSALSVALVGAGARTQLLIVDPVGADALGHWTERFSSVTVLPPTDDAVDAALGSGVAVAVVDGARLVDALPNTQPTGPLVVVIDDGPPHQVAADLLVNPNLTASAEQYRTTGPDVVLAGSAYSLIDPDLRQYRVRSAPARQARRILVTCGGADPARLTERYLDVVRPLLGQFSVTVLIGPANGRRADLAAQASKLGATPMTGQAGIGPLASAHDLALTALGTTASELACLGIPNLAAAIDVNQLPYLSAYEQAGFLVSLGWHADLRPTHLLAEIMDLAADRVRRLAMCDIGRGVVDGKGADRVAAAILARLR